MNKNEKELNILTFDFNSHLKEHGIKMDNKCQNCVSRFLCPTYKENKCCAGYNDEQVFRGLLKMCLYGYLCEDQINEMLDYVKDIQRR